MGSIEDLDAVTTAAKALPDLDGQICHLVGHTPFPLTETSVIVLLEADPVEVRRAIDKLVRDGRLRAAHRHKRGPRRTRHLQASP